MYVLGKEWGHHYSHFTEFAGMFFIISIWWYGIPTWGSFLAMVSCLCSLIGGCGSNGAIGRIGQTKGWWVANAASDQAISIVDCGYRIKQPPLNKTKPSFSCTVHTQVRNDTTHKWRI